MDLKNKIPLRKRIPKAKKVLILLFFSSEPSIDVRAVNYSHDNIVRTHRAMENINH